MDEKEYITGKELLIELGKYLIWYCVILIVLIVFIPDIIGINAIKALMISGFSYLGYKKFRWSREKKTKS